MDKVRENRLRRMAGRLGYQIVKSRARRVHIDNRGLYQVVDVSTDTVVHGARYDADIDDVEWFLTQQEAELVSLVSADAGE